MLFCLMALLEKKWHVLKPGTPEHRNTGTPEHRNTGTARNTGTPERRNTPEHRNTEFDDAVFFSHYRHVKNKMPI